MTGPLRQCGRPDCRLCSHNVPGEPPDSGHPIDEEPLAALLVGIAAIVVLAVVFFVILPAALG